ncbi:hypothetical protein CPB84DRAFT_610998 [Gymnopilus junonius]|uniref:Uncharacterized protein n=1 Tax=Gymnopilus junonius TaxID=109634 RepID=A0A9P5NQ64_GYMJU|nr:hypothetical protein CPB84DRAFT_610998 [Gymnopilus junonius]
MLPEDSFRLPFYSQGLPVNCFSRQVDGRSPCPASSEKVRRFSLRLNRKRCVHRSHRFWTNNLNPSRHSCLYSLYRFRNVSASLAMHASHCLYLYLTCNTPFRRPALFSLSYQLLYRCSRPIICCLSYAIWHSHLLRFIVQCRLSGRSEPFLAVCIQSSSTASAGLLPRRYRFSYYRNMGPYTTIC